MSHPSMSDGYQLGYVYNRIIEHFLHLALENIEASYHHEMGSVTKRGDNCSKYDLSMGSKKLFNSCEGVFLLTS